MPRAKLSIIRKSGERLGAAAAAVVSAEQTMTNRGEEEDDVVFCCSADEDEEAASSSPSAAAVPEKMESDGSGLRRSTRARKKKRFLDEEDDESEEDGPKKKKRRAATPRKPIKPEPTNSAAAEPLPQKVKEEPPIATAAVAPSAASFTDAEEVSAALSAAMTLATAASLANGAVPQTTTDVLLKTDDPEAFFLAEQSAAPPQPSAGTIASGEERWETLDGWSLVCVGSLVSGDFRGKWNAACARRAEMAPGPRKEAQILLDFFLSTKPSKSESSEWVSFLRSVRPVLGPGELAVLAHIKSAAEKNWLQNHFRLPTVRSEHVQQPRQSPAYLLPRSPPKPVTEVLKEYVLALKKREAASVTQRAFRYRVRPADVLEVLDEVLPSENKAAVRALANLADQVRQVLPTRVAALGEELSKGFCTWCDRFVGEKKRLSLAMMRRGAPVVDEAVLTANQDSWPDLLDPLFHNVWREIGMVLLAKDMVSLHNLQLTCKTLHEWFGVEFWENAITDKDILRHPAVPKRKLMAMLASTQRKRCMKCGKKSSAINDAHPLEPVVCGNCRDNDPDLQLIGKFDAMRLYDIPAPLVEDLPGHNDIVEWHWSGPTVWRMVLEKDAKALASYLTKHPGDRDKKHLSPKRGVHVPSVPAGHYALPVFYRSAKTKQARK